MAITQRKINEKIAKNKALTGEELGRYIMYYLIDSSNERKTHLNGAIVQQNINNFNAFELSIYNFYVAFYGNIARSFYWRDDYTARAELALLWLKDILENMLQYESIKADLEARKKKAEKKKEAFINDAYTLEEQKKLTFIYEPEKNINEQIALYNKLFNSTIEDLKANRTLKTEIQDYYESFIYSYKNLLAFNDYLDIIGATYKLSFEVFKTKQQIEHLGEYLKTIDKIKENIKNLLEIEGKKEALRLFNSIFNNINLEELKPIESAKNELKSQFNDNIYSLKAKACIMETSEGVSHLIGETTKGLLNDEDKDN